MPLDVILDAVVATMVDPAGADDWTVLGLRLDGELSAPIAWEAWAVSECCVACRHTLIPLIARHREVVCVVEFVAPTASPYPELPVAQDQKSVGVDTKAGGTRKRVTAAAAARRSSATAASSTPRLSRWAEPARRRQERAQTGPTPQRTEGVSRPFAEEARQAGREAGGEGHRQAVPSRRQAAAKPVGQKAPAKKASAKAADKQGRRRSARQEGPGEGTGARQQPAKARRTGEGSRRRRRPPTARRVRRRVRRERPRQPRRRRAEPGRAGEVAAPEEARRRRRPRVSSTPTPTTPTSPSSRSRSPAPRPTRSRTT